MSPRLPIRALRSSFFTIICLALALAGAGCNSTSGPASASFASVVIRGRTPQEIAGAAAQVFREDGYSVLPGVNGQMIFQKEGSRMNNLAYEGAVNSYYGAQTYVRVKADIVPLENDACRLQCQAYMTRGAGDAFFEEEQRLTNIRRRPYQSLLNKVAKQLK